MYKSGLEPIECKSYLSIFGDHLPNISYKNNDIECKLSFECRHMQPFSFDTWKAKHWVEVKIVVTYYTQHTIQKNSYRNEESVKGK